MSIPLDNSTTAQTGIAAASSFNQIYDLSYADSASFVCNTSGATAGTLKIQQSNDRTNWIDIAAQTVTISSAASLFSLLYVPPTGAWTKFCRILFTVTTGTGAISIVAETRSISMASN